MDEKATGLLIGALMEGAVPLGFVFFVGFDHAVLFVGLCGLFFGVVLMTAVVVSPRTKRDGGETSNRTYATVLNRGFPQAVVIAAAAIAGVSLVVGPEGVHDFARDTVGFPEKLTTPFLKQF